MRANPSPDLNIGKTAKLSVISITKTSICCVLFLLLVFVIRASFHVYQNGELVLALRYYSAKWRNSCHWESFSSLFKQWAVNYRPASGNLSALHMRMGVFHPAETTSSRNKFDTIGQMTDMRDLALSMRYVAVLILFPPTPFCWLTHLKKVHAFYLICWPKLQHVESAPVEKKCAATFSRSCCQVLG